MSNKQANIQLKVEKFRSIAEADIKLNDITLLSGTNGCGKSTLSRLLYYTVYYINNYEQLADELLYKLSRDYSQYLLDLYQSIQNRLGRHEKLIKIKDFPAYERLRKTTSRFWLLGEEYSTAPLKEDFLEVLNVCVNAYNSNDLEPSESDRQQLARFLKKNIENNTAFISGLKQLENSITDLYLQDDIVRESRPTELVIEQIKNSFDNKTLPQFFHINEWGESIVQCDNNSINDFLGVLRSLKKVVYIDTPMIMSMEYNSIRRKPFVYQTHWDALMELLYDKSVDEKENELTQELATIVGGNIKIKEREGGFVRTSDLRFVSADNEFDINIKEAATGIKSLLILQRLLQIDYLDEFTLLIIDEPEAHLHPQWIVEYAKIVVELNKRKGVMFLIASHSTDFVQALSLYGDHEKMLDGDNPQMHFYLAEASQDNTFTFKNCRGDIEPIFKTFNKSYDIMFDHVKNMSVKDEDNE